MQKPNTGDKDLLNLQETIEHFKLSRRKFAALMKSKETKPFLVMYGSRKLVIRTEFETYMKFHPELRRCR